MVNKVRCPICDNDFPDWAETCDEGHGIQEIIEYLESLQKKETEYQSKWISIKTEMPEKSLVVLIRDIDNSIWLSRWDGEVWRSANTSDTIWIKKDRVIEWTTIPE